MRLVVLVHLAAISIDHSHTVYFYRQLQISSRSLAVQSKIKANEAEIIKLVNHLENTQGVGV